MATPIDDKVVAMSFESSKFERGVNDTINSLDKLKKALTFKDAGAGLESVSRAVGHFQLNRIGDAAENVQKRLRAMQLVAISVLGNIAASAVRSGAQFVKSFTLQPIIQGFQEYATNLNAVQTILANTQASGATLKDVNGALLDLNKYSDKTIYNFSQMARNIGTFTAAGVDLKTSTASIKGIANLAALSGSNAEQASTAMYQLSQAISAGRVGLQDWNSVVNAGMGGTVFQRALAQTAEAMGTLQKGAVKLEGPMKNVSIHGESFRQSMQAGPGKKSWLTSKVLTTTLKQFTGDLSDAELAAMGFNETQIKAIQQTAKTAQHAATEVKTLSQVLDVAKETAGSGWAQTWQVIFGNFGEAKTTFTALSNAINGVINTSSNARNKMLADWKDLGGRTLLINSLKEAFHNLGLMLKAISAGFRAVFPRKTGQDLFNMTKGFAQLVDKMTPSTKTLSALNDISGSFFSILHIGLQVLKGVVKMFGAFFKAIGGGKGNFLDFVANNSLFFQKIDNWLEKGNKLNKFFIGLGTFLAKPVKAILRLADAIGELFSRISSGGDSGKLDGISKGLSPLKRIVEIIGKVWDKFVSSIENANIQPAVDAVVKTIQSIGPAIGKAASTMSFEPILSVIRTGLLGGMFVILKRFLGKGSLLEQLSNTGGGFVKNLSSMFDNLTGSLKALQTNIKADTLLKIAKAVAFLTASVVALSFVDPEKLKSALAGMTVAFGQLLGAMAILTATTKTAGFIKLPVISAALIELAFAMDLMSAAVLMMSRLDWNQLGKGLAGVGGSLAILVAAVGPLGRGAPGLIRAGVGVTALAIGLNIMARAVKQFGGMNLKELGKGLAAVAISLGLIATGVEGMPTERMIAAGIGLIGIAIALRIMGNVFEKFAGMNLKQLAKGMVGVGGSLVAIAYAMELFPPGMPLIAAGLLVVSFALGRIAKAVLAMSKMGWMEIAKGLAALGGALVILAGAMALMQESVAGAAALTVVSAGIFLLSKALVSLGKQSWGQILKSLVSLAGALVIIGAAGILLTEAIPSLLGLGAALVLIGGGLALAGAGIALIGVGLSAIAVAGPTAVGILISALTQLEAAIIKNAKNLILGILQIADVLAATAPKFMTAIVKILNTVVDGLIKILPKLVQLIEALVDAIVKIFHDKQDKIIQAGIDLILALLIGIRNNIGAVVKTIVDIITNILNAIAKNIGRIVTAGLNVLLALIKGIASGYTKVISTAVTIVTKFLEGIANNLGKIATMGLNILAKFLGAIAGGIGRVITAGANLVVNILTGIGNNIGRVATAGTNMMIRFMNALVKESLKLVDAGARAVIRFLNGIAAAIDKYEPEMIRAGTRIGIAIAKGMIKGMAQSAKDVAKAGIDMAKGAVGGIAGHLGFNSPAKALIPIGQGIGEGMALGMDDHKNVIDSAIAMSKNLISSVTNILGIASPSKVFFQIGQAVTQGFAEGIRGSADDIKNAWAEMDQKLLEAARGARETIASERAKLKDEMAQTHPDAAAIKKAQDIIAQNQALLSKSVAGHVLLTQTLAVTRNQLMGLANQYDSVATKLSDAQKKLADLKKERDDAIKGFTDQYSTLPDIVTTDAEGNAVNQLATYEDALKHQADAVAAYQSTLDQLRALGLDDATYQKLLEEGTADQQFATQLLAGGKTAVQGLNALDAQLKKNATVLAQHAGHNLKDAGIAAAQGIVQGLKTQESTIRKEMETIARIMVQALKNELGIKSPSTVFAELGRYSMEGFSAGFSGAAGAITDAAMGALEGVKKTINDISDAIATGIDSNPVITPILDLSQVQAQAADLDSLTKMTPISTATSFGQASAISAMQQPTTADETVGTVPGTSIKFEQNNYSPESLSEIEIYRQTNNVLSQLKTAAGIA
jgi:tape measure domain-containing protein